MLKSIYGFPALQPTGTRIMGRVMANSQFLYVRVFLYPDYQIYKYDVVTKTLVAMFSLQNTLALSSEIKDIQLDSIGNLWIVQSGHTQGHTLVKYDGTNWTAINPTNSPIKDAFKIGANISRSKLYVLANTNPQKLYQFANNQWQELANIPFSNFDEDIVAANSNYLWFYGNLGLSRLDLNYLTNTDDLAKERPQISAYIAPNPSNGKVRLAFKGGIDVHNLTEITVNDLFGRPIARFSGNYAADSILDLDLDTVASGIYMVTIKSGNKSVIQKVVVQH